jgi:hypothetical protein
VIAEHDSLAWYIRGGDRKTRQEVEEQLIRCTNGAIERSRLFESQAHIVLYGS